MKLTIEMEVNEKLTVAEVVMMLRAMEGTLVKRARVVAINDTRLPAPKGSAK